MPIGLFSRVLNAGRAHGGMRAGGIWRMVFPVCLLAAWMPAAETLMWEAEDLVGDAVIGGGGDLVVFGVPDDGDIVFSGGRALSFVPRGKGSYVEFRLPVEEAGVYRLRLRGVAGPSCGYYRILHGGRDCGHLNFSREETRHTDNTPNMQNGCWSKRMLLEAGVNRIRFENVQSPRRGGNLVLDTVELVPFRRPAREPVFDAYDAALPPGERLGDELLKNGDFESFLDHHRFDEQNRQVQNWQFNSAVPARSEIIVRDPVRARSGRIALQLTPDPLEDYAIVYQTFPAESGKPYRISLYARGAGRIRVDFYQYGGKPSPADSQRAHNTFRLEPEWQLYTFVFVPSVAGRITHCAIALHGAESGEAFFDDVSVREILNPAP